MVTMLVFVLGYGLLNLVQADTPADNPAWAAPGAITLKAVGAMQNRSHPVLETNLDCQSITYLQSSGDTHTGCLQYTAFGFLDDDNSSALFTGVDRALPIIPQTPSQVLVGWPGTIDVLALNSISTGGSAISLYQNILGAITPVTNSLGQVIGQQITKPPDFRLVDNTGVGLVIYPQTLAFSSDGAWLVVETVNGVFVRINLATLNVLPFAPGFGTSSNAIIGKIQATVSDDGRYVAIENDLAASFRVYDLSQCGQTVPSGLQLLNCPSHDYWPYISSQVNETLQISTVRFINDGILDFDVSGSTSGNYELAPTAGITNLIQYLGLGDSYTSGEGAGTYEQGTDTDTNACHLSSLSYPLLLRHDLWNDGHSVACSGAVIDDLSPGNPNNYRGQVKGGVPFYQRSSGDVAQLLTAFVPGNLAQSAFVKQYQPGVLTVSVGGNDIGFADILQNCVEPHLGLGTANTCYATYEDRLEIKNLVDRVVPRWEALYARLKQWSPASQIYAIDYPEIAVSAGNCALNVHLDQSELVFANDLIDYLDASIAKAASSAGVAYIDINQALAGHRLCEVASYDVAVNGLTTGKGAGPFSKGSYHPNALGQELIEQAILHQTDNFQQSPPAAPNNSGQNLVAAPKSGRVINVIIPATMVDSAVTKGASISVALDGLSKGLVPKQLYQVHLGGTSGVLLGTLMSDGFGSLNGSVTIPTTANSGNQSLDVTGKNQASESLDITQSIFIPAGPTDADGDGLPDSLDSCPGNANSGQDADGDGIDDACDAVIGPSTGSTSGGNAAGTSRPGPAGSASNNTELVAHMDVMSGQPQAQYSSATPAQGHDTQNAAVLGTATNRSTTHSIPNTANKVTFADPDPAELPHWAWLRTTILASLALLILCLLVWWSLGWKQAGVYKYGHWP